MGLFLENSEVMSSPCWGSGATANKKKVQQMNGDGLNIKLISGQAISQGVG